MSKCVLDYTKEELNSLSVDELTSLAKEAQNKENLYNVRQLVEKTLINGLYGALANKYFPLFNEKMAAAITGNGRYFIRKLANYIEDVLQDTHKSDKPYIVYGDTDSCTGDTLIETSKGKYKIEDLYNDITGDIEIRGKDNFIKHTTEHITTKSVNKSLNVDDKPITYIMRHKVNKRMFKIKCNDDEVIITEDHSIMVIRDNELIEVKATELIELDKLVKINTH